MTSFFIIIGILIAVNFILLHFSCNSEAEPDPDEE